MARNLDEPGANFNQLLELSMKLENARTFASKPNGVTTLTSDDWDIWLQQNDPNYQTLEEEELNAGGRVGYGEGGIDFYPYISGSKSNIPLEDEYNVDLKNLMYGGTLMGQKDNIFAGVEGLKIKNKINFMKENDTLFKDTTDKEKLSFILGYGDPKGNKIQIKADKDLENILATLSLKFNKGGRVGYGEGDIVPQTKPFTADMFKDKADLYIQGMFGGMDQNLLLPKIEDVLERAINDGSITQEEGMKFIMDRKAFYENFAKENPKGTMPRWEKWLMADGILTLKGPVSQGLNIKYNTAKVVVS